MSNLKIDIIYYKTSSDFELEFNLSGCCRMRIFKDKVESQKGLVNTLARDVARSKIIIVVTDLLGEESGVPALSKAIGLPLISPNKDEYGIKTGDAIFMPNTAVPLVTRTGIYGGSIIESGPLSIIIVSSVRSLRHEIMKAYVHNYVFDVGQLMAYKERMGENSHNIMPPITSSVNLPHEEIILPSAEPSTVSEEITGYIQSMPTKSVSDETIAENNPPVTEETSIPAQDQLAEEIPQAPKSELEMAIEEEILNNTPKKISRVIQPGISAVDQFEFDEAEEKELYKKSRKKRKGSNILLLILIILLLIGFGVLAYFFVYLPLTGAENTFGGEANFLTDFIESLFS